VSLEVEVDAVDLSVLAGALRASCRIGGGHGAAPLVPAGVILIQTAFRPELIGVAAR
jgi:hypothetical protein